MIQFFKDCFQFILNCFQTLIEYITFWDDHIEVDLPDSFLIYEPFRFMLFCWIGIFLFTVLLKVTKKLPNFKEGIISAVSILVLFVGYVFLAVYNPLGIARLLPEHLPFIDIQEDRVLLTAYRQNETGFVDLLWFFRQVGYMIVLAYIVNFVYYTKPGNLKTPGWIICRFFSNLAVFAGHYGFYRIITKFIGMVPVNSFLYYFLPYAPLLLIGALLGLFIVGNSKKLAIRIFKVPSFAFDGLNGYFFTKKSGILFTRSICTTLILSVFMYMLQQTCEAYYLQAAVPFVNLSGMAVTSLIGLFILWILVGFVL